MTVMTTIARYLPGGQRAIAAIDPCHGISKQTESTPASASTEPAHRRSVRDDYAWVEAAALAGAHTPRG